MLQKECRYDILVYGKTCPRKPEKDRAYDAAGLFLSVKKGLS